MSGSKDQTIRVWDASTRRCLFSMSGHTMVGRGVQGLGGGACQGGTLSEIWCFGGQYGYGMHLQGATQ